MTTEEQNEVSNQILMVGQLVGLTWRINPQLLKKWLAHERELQKQGASDFRYEKQVSAVIQFVEDAR